MRVDDAELSGAFVFAETALVELRIMLMLFIPIVFCNIFEYIPQWIAYAFVGHIPNSTVLLASVGLSMTFTNCFGISITYGLSKGLDTLIPQALGQLQVDSAFNINKRISIYFQQALLVTFITLIPLLCLQYFAGDIMCIIGQSQEVCGYINDYCRALIPLLIASWWYIMLCRLIRPLNLNNTSMIITTICAVTSYPLNYLFITHLKYNYLATAVVMDICQVAVALANTILLIYKGYGTVFIPQSATNVLNKNGIKTYLQLSIPTMISSSGDWWISEMITLLSGYVHNPSISVAAASVGVALDAIMSEFNNAAAEPLSIRIGKHMGSGNVTLAKRAMWMGLIVSSMVITILISVSLSLRYSLPYIWISMEDETLGDLIANVVYFVCLRQLFYNMFIALSGIYIGLGMQKYTATISTVCNYSIGLPLTLILLFQFNLRENQEYYGIYVIWGCNSLGYALTTAVLVFLLLIQHINWNNALDQSQNRLEKTIADPNYEPLI
eukprot:402192_1